LEEEKKAVAGEKGGDVRLGEIEEEDLKGIIP